MVYGEIIKLISEYVNGSMSIYSSQRFCDEYMEMFYNIQNDLEQEVMRNIYELLDDINLLCDSYESNVKIRETDKYCIDEISLKNKVTELYKILKE